MSYTCPVLFGLHTCASFIRTLHWHRFSFTEDFAGGDTQVPVPKRPSSNRSPPTTPEDTENEDGGAADVKMSSPALNNSNGQTDSGGDDSAKENKSNDGDRPAKSSKKKGRWIASTQLTSFCRDGDVPRSGLSIATPEK